MKWLRLALNVFRNEGPVSLLVRLLRRVRTTAQFAVYRLRMRIGLVPAVSPVSIISGTLCHEPTAILEAIWQLARVGDVRVVVPNSVVAPLNRIAPCSVHRLDAESYSELLRCPTMPFDAIALQNGLLHRLPLELVKRALGDWTPVLQEDQVAVFSSSPNARRAAPTASGGESKLLSTIAALERLSSDQLLFEAPFGAQMRCHYSATDMGIIGEVWHEYLGWGLNLDECDVIVDIGANIGAFSVACAVLSPRATVYAFEPCPDNFKLLEENIARNCPGRVRARRQAVHREEGFRTLYLNAEQSGGHTLYGGIGGGGTIAVECVSLSELFAEIGRPIDILKIDAEGAEYDILFCCGELLRSRVRTLVMETHRCGLWTGNDMVKFLKGLGFHVETKGGPDFMLLLAQAPDQGTITAADLASVPSAA